MNAVKYMKEFLIIFFGFLSFICLLFIAVGILALPVLGSHYLESAGFNDFIVYSAFVLQYMIIYVIARSTKFIDDEILGL
tara:strand:+ start:4056 stop:4295 length:240 start_codon:yes stop_codon:yes gene_type:complete